MLSPENTARLQQIRAAVLTGTATLDDEKEGIRILRADRISASSTSAKAKTKKAEDAAPIDTGAVLANLKAIGTKLSSGPVA